MINKNHKILFGLPSELFWDVDVSQLDAFQHSSYIIERILSRGNWTDFKNLLAFYGHSYIAKRIVRFRYMDSLIFSFCVVYFKIPKHKFRCYTKRHLMPTHWNY